MTLVLAILPMVAVVAAGYALGRTGVVPREQWSGIETLSFRALIPAVLILAIAGSDLSLDRFGGMIAAILGTLLLLSLAVFALRYVMGEKLGSPAFTTLYQTSVRWNAFVALAAAEQFMGRGIDTLAVAIAVSIPTINIACILVLAGFGPTRASALGIARTVALNPLVQACVIGLAINFAGVTLPFWLIQTLDLIGRAALGVGLMAVGAGISLRRLSRVDLRVVAGAVMRPLFAPLLFLGLAVSFRLGITQALAGVLVFCAPAASNGYIVAKKMGGDAELYADVLTWQTVLSLAILPVWVWFLSATFA